MWNIACKVECKTALTSQLYTLFLVIVFVSVSVSVLGKGTQKCGKVWSLPNPPRTHLPLPVWSSFSQKKGMFCVFSKFVCWSNSWLVCPDRQNSHSAIQIFPSHLFCYRLLGQYFIWKTNKLCLGFAKIEYMWRLACFASNDYYKTASAFFPWDPICPTIWEKKTERVAKEDQRCIFAEKE